MDFVVILTILVASSKLIESEGQPQVPCFFIFGDSLSDSGNNNNLASFAKANFLPYGIDFPAGPTGRFTNGRTTVDLIGESLGLENYIPPFSEATGLEIVKGVNYASGSAGIRSETGFQVGMRMSMDEQIQNHQTIVSKIATTLENNNSTIHLNKCLYSVYVGSNDWMANYFNGATTRFQYTPQAYADALISQLSQQLTSLYKSGARKVILFGLGPLGCLPLLRRFGRCSDYINVVLEMYNIKLRSLVDTLNNKFKDGKFIWINTMGIVSPNNLEGLGLKITRMPCCGAFQFLCLPASIPCGNREDYAYWDNAHPTEAANKVLASRAFKAKESTDTYPMDISHLAQA